MHRRRRRPSTAKRRTKNGYCTVEKQLNHQRTKRPQTAGKCRSTPNQSSLLSKTSPSSSTSKKRGFAFRVHERRVINNPPRLDNILYTLIRKPPPLIRLPKLTTPIKKIKPKSKPPPPKPINLYIGSNIEWWVYAMEKTEAHPSAFPSNEDAKGCVQYLEHKMNQDALKKRNLIQYQKKRMIHKMDEASKQKTRFNVLFKGTRSKHGMREVGLFKEHHPV